MKKYFFTITILCVIRFLPAQNYYKLTTGISTYSDLNNPIMLSSGLLLQGYYCSDSLIFPYYGFSMDFRNKLPSAFGAYIDKDGFIAVDESSHNYTEILDIAYGNYAWRDSTTSISAVYEGQRGSGILKFQWKNLGIDGNPDDNFVNFQMWFNETDKSISFHYGPSNLSGSADPVIGLMRAPNNADTLTHSTLLKGKASQPSRLTVFSTRKLPVYPVVGFPPNGTVYTFKANSGDLKANKQTLASKIYLYPNPANDKLIIGNLKPSSLKVLNSNGQQLMDAKNTSELDISHLEPGLYLVIIDNLHYLKFLKE